MKKQSNIILNLSIAVFLFVMGLGLGTAFTAESEDLTVSYSVSATTIPSNYYSTSEGVIFKGTNPIKLKGANWFGFETADHVMHGLWSRGYVEMIQQIKDTGINALRVPVCPATLAGVDSIGAVDYSKNSDLQGKNSLELLDAIMEELNRQQIYVLLDMHRVDTDCGYISDLWYVDGYSETQWINDLKFMADYFSGYEYFMGIDLKNEPHGNATWGTGNSATDWNTAAEKAGEAVLSVNPNILIYVEGVQENPTCSLSNYNHWWGGNLEPFACDPIDPDMVPKSKLVLSPHVYGPDVYNQPYFSVSNFPANMAEIWDQHFGYLVEEGYTIVPGEWGGKYGIDGNDEKDKIWQDALVDYFQDKHICNSFYWSWNPNSGDTGGILQDDWNNTHSEKVTMLNNYWDGCSLPAATISPIEVPGISIDPPTDPSGGVVCSADVLVCSDGTSVTRDPENGCEFKECPMPTESATSSASSSQSSVTTSSASSQTSSSAATSSTSSSSSSKPVSVADTYCDVTYKVVNQWSNGFVAEVVVKNNSGAQIKNWNLGFDFEGNQKVTQIWNGRVEQSNKNTTIRSVSYNRNIENGASVSFGFVASYSGSNQKLQSADFKLKGVQCGVQQDGGSIDPVPEVTTDPVSEVDSNYCKVEYKVVSQWADGFVADVKVKNISGNAIDGWNLKWAFPGNQEIVNSWNTSLGQSGKNITASDADYNARINAGASRSFGFQATYSGQNGEISGSQFKLNGNVCE